MLLIKNGKIFKTKENKYQCQDILIDSNKIVKIADTIENNGYEVIDASNKLVYPGFIDAHTHMGVMELVIGPDGYDNNEMGDPISPQLRGIDSINPETRSYADARRVGVTTIVAGPGSQNIIGGTHAALKTYGNRVDDMLVKNHVAMKCAFGENPKKSYGGRGIAPVTRRAQVAMFRETLYKAKEYMEMKEKSKGDLTKMANVDIKMEALIPVLTRQIPLKAHAHRADDILNALRVAKEFNLRIILIHATEGHLVAQKIKEADAACILGPTFNDGGKMEMKNVSFRTHKILNEAGVKIAIQTDAPITPILDFPLMAAMAVREGLNEIEAIKAITINAAEIYGFDDRVGSLEEGKDADIVISKISPLEFNYAAWKVLINGKLVYSAEEGN